MRKANGRIMQTDKASLEKLNVAILIFPDVEVLDFAGPFEIFSRTRLVGGVESRRSDASAPFSVFTIAKSTAPILATGGLAVTPKYSFQQHPAIDLLVVPGGYGTRALLEDQETLAWISKASAQARTTASVCTGSLLLTAAGVLKNQPATTHWGALSLLETLSQKHSANLQVDHRRRVVDAGNGVITSAGVSSGIDMALYLVEQMFGAAVADETAKYVEFRRTDAVVA